MNKVFGKNYVVLLFSALAVLAALAYISLDSLLQMMHAWSAKEEYGYAYIIPFIVLFFIWQQKNELLSKPMTFSWVGLAMALAGTGVVLLGLVSATQSIVQYGFVTALIGIVLMSIGWSAFSVILMPMLMLYLIIPLPAFLYNNLSAYLQLISSQIGVWVIRLFDISVYLEGNVIDLGSFKLQVVEACSGLRYLFPLFSLAVIAAYIYKAAMWKRLVLILSSIPITILMNSFRIGVIGILVEYWGIEQAEGFLHDFEGWIIFMACTGLLVLEIWLMTHFGKKKERLSDVFAVDFPDPLSSRQLENLPGINFSYALSLGLVLMTVFLVGSVDKREEIIPDRKTFAEFPINIDGWKGRNDQLESIYLDALKLDDYILADYSDGNGAPVNFYVAYYASQSTGEAAHSPKSCLPGGGWKMTDFSRQELVLQDPERSVVPVNRVVIKKGNYTQLVYYWFQQRNRRITNEYMVKWFLFWDAMTKNRTDGALVRLSVIVASGDDVSVADERLRGFLSDITPYLPPYIPG